MRRRLDMSGERGAVMIQAATAMVVLFGLGAFVVDYGVLWLSREQAQNAADAGAMAAAIALAYDGAGSVVASATSLVALNPVWSTPAVTEVLPRPCPPGSSGSFCIRVNVYRDGTSGSATLPVVFGPVLGITSQGVRATATAQVGIGNGTRCLKPWAIPDRWVEHRPVDKPWEPGDVFEKYVETGPGAGTVLVPADEYTPPSPPGSPGTGMRPALDLGAPTTISFSDPAASDPIVPGLLLPVVPAGSTSYDQSIASCNGQISAVGAYLPTDAAATALQTTAGVSALIAADPGATWNGARNRIEGTCAPGCAAISPRLAALAIYDVDEYQYMRATGVWCAGGVQCVKVVNMVGFFIDAVTAGGATGYLTKYPGLISPASPRLPQISSFLPAVTLVR